MNGKTKLTLKQENFCLIYLECGNASEAYRHVYSCDNMKDESINRKAAELLNNGKITARVKELQTKTVTKSEITKERIIKELSCILESKITDYVELNQGNLKFKDFNKLTESQVRAIESIKQGRNGLELKLHSKSWTIERICKMLGFDSSIKAELTGKNGESLINEPILIEIIDSREKVDG